MTLSTHTAAAAASALVLVVLSAIPAAVSAQPTATSYDIGDAIITQDQFPPHSKFHDMPLALRGSVAWPEGEGPFPVALIVHGSYQFCTARSVDEEVDVYPCPPEDDLRQFEGFGYLAEALASSGYVALVPDLSAEYTNGFGEAIFAKRAIGIIDAHLDALVAPEHVGHDGVGQADLSRLVVAGHSRGGPISVRYITDADAATRDVSALALLTPAYLAPESKIPRNLPTALLISECDGDEGTGAPLLYFEKQLHPLRPAITTVYTLAGGTHNAFSTQLHSDRAATCTAGDVLAPEAQRHIVTTFLPDFFDMALAQVDVSAE